MNNQNSKLFLFSLFLICLMAVGLGCSEDEECQSSSSACGSFTACCTSSDCYYLAGDGTRFDCNGTDCSAAAEQLADHMCKKLRDESPEAFNRLVDEILESANERVILLR